MGILGLLQFIKASLKERKLSDYRGKTVAVDTYAWLHKIIKGPSGKQFILGGANRYKYVKDCLKRIEKIESLGIKVIMVFDGGPLPGKRQEEESRRKRREETCAKGKEMLENGDEAGFKKLVDSIDVTPDIAYRLIVELKKKGVQYIVAPYEADAQLAYLSRQGIADVIITQDSDLMSFGAKRMLYKLDFATMTGDQMQIDEIPSCKDVSFTWFTHCMFLTTCILSGCDYLNQIPGIGIKTAQRSIGRVTTFRGFLGEIANKSLIPSDYQQNFMKAFLTFRFQRVYCPRRKACVQLNPIDHISKSMQQLQKLEKDGLKWSEEVLNFEVTEYAQMNNLNYSFLGQKYSDELACRIAEADVHPVTLVQYNISSSDNLIYVPTVPIRMNSVVNKIRQNYSKGSKYQPRKQKDNGNEVNLMAKFLTQPYMKKITVQKYNPFLEYKSVKDDAQNQCITFQDQKMTEEVYQKAISECRPVKGRLKLTEDDDEDISSEEESANISYLSSESMVQQISHLEVTANKRQPTKAKSCKEELQQIAEKLFGQIFSQQYLKNPFSF